MNKKILSVLMSICLIFTMFGSLNNFSYADDNDVVKDPNLKRAINKQLKRSEMTNITKDELSR